MSCSPSFSIALAPDSFIFKNRTHVAASHALLCSSNAMTDPQSYSKLAEECRLWAQGLGPPVRGLTAEDLSKAQAELKRTLQPFPAGYGGSSGRNRSVRPSQKGGGPHGIDPRSSKYFIQPPVGEADRDAGRGPQGRYPRRSCRGRNQKRDELYVPLDSDREEDDEGEVDAEEDHDGLQGVGSEAAAAKRGPGRPRKNSSSHQKQCMAATTPVGRLLPLSGASPGAYSPFSLFLLDHQDQSGVKGHDDGPDVVDYAALDEFIAGLNFTNDTLLGSPVLRAAQGQTHAQGGPDLTTVQADAAEAQPPPGMVPTHAVSLPMALASTSAEMPAELAPAACDVGPSTSAGPPPAAMPALPGAGVPEHPAPLAPIMGCKLLETPSLAGMLSLDPGNIKATPLVSPSLDPLLLSPTLLALNF